MPAVEPAKVAPVLSREQERRAVACERAAALLRERAVPFGKVAGADAMDVVQVARFILDGRDPWPPTEVPDGPRLGVEA